MGVLDALLGQAGGEAADSVVPRWATRGCGLARRSMPAPQPQPQAEAWARATNVQPYLDAVRRAGRRTLHEPAETLTNRGVPTPAGSPISRQAYTSPRQIPKSSQA